MAELKSFRNAFNGFNKDDVVRYLEYINSKHQNQVSQLQAEIEELRSAQAEDQTEQLESLQQENADLTGQLEAAQAQIQVLEAQLADAKNLQNTACVPAPEAIRADVSLELETYRRAERIEREARDRAELIYFQANNVLKEANAKIDGTMVDMTDMADQVIRQLTQLQMVVNNSKLALQDATEVLNTLRPNR